MDPADGRLLARRDEFRHSPRCDRDRRSGQSEGRRRRGRPGEAAGARILGGDNHPRRHGADSGALCRLRRDRAAISVRSVPALSLAGRRTTAGARTPSAHAAPTQNRHGRARQTARVTNRPPSREELAAEARRRLRLSRIVSGLTTASASVHPSGEADGFDVVIRLSPPDPDTAARVRAVSLDMQVQVQEGWWRRS